MALIPLIMAGVSIIEGISNSSAARGQASANIDMIDKQLDMIIENKKALENAYESQKGYVTDKYGNAVKSMNEQIGMTYEGLNKQYESSVSKSNLAYSGSIESNRSLASRDVQSRYESGITGKRDALQSTMLDMATNHQNQINQLHAQWTQLRGQRAAFEQQKKTKFLGIL